MLNASQIATLINEVYDGVERSKVGDIMMKNPDGSLSKNEDGFSRLNTLPMQTFLTLLNCLSPKELFPKELIDRIS